MIHAILQVLAVSILVAAGILVTTLTIAAYAWLIENLPPVAIALACGGVMWAASFVGWL